MANCQIETALFRGATASFYAARAYSKPRTGRIQLYGGSTCKGALESCPAQTGALLAAMKIFVEFGQTEADPRVGPG